MDDLHHRLRLAREKAGLQQRQLAAILQVNPSAVSHWETGRRKPGRDLLAKIAETTMTDTQILHGIDAKMPRIRARSVKVVMPNDSSDLTDAEREVLMFWRGLSDRQRENFLKLIRVSFAVRSEIERER